MIRKNMLSWCHSFVKSIILNLVFILYATKTVYKPYTLSIILWKALMSGLPKVPAMLRPCRNTAFLLCRIWCSVSVTRYVEIPVYCPTLVGDHPFLFISTSIIKISNFAVNRDHLNKK